MTNVAMVRSQLRKEVKGWGVSVKVSGCSQGKKGKINVSFFVNGNTKTLPVNPNAMPKPQKLKKQLGLMCG